MAGQEKGIDHATLDCPSKKRVSVERFSPALLGKESLGFVGWRARRGRKSEATIGPRRVRGEGAEGSSDLDTLSLPGRSG